MKDMEYITPDILEKNGFVNFNNEVYTFNVSSGDGYVKVRLCDLLDGEWELYVDNYNKFEDSHTTFSSDRIFLKVHELQHVLRICGIKKEIVL